MKESTSGKKIDFAHYWNKSVNRILGPTIQDVNSLQLCTLPPLNLLNFEVSPVIFLRVTPTNEDCMVEMLSCKVSLGMYIMFKLMRKTDLLARSQ
ncbi:MraW methylase family protein, partial [Tanacetum coccineum]